MVTRSEAAGTGVGACAGITQTFLLREYVDKKAIAEGKDPRWIPQLKDFGTASSLLGWVPGIILTSLGAYAIWTGKVIRSGTVQMLVLGYGVSTLLGGVLSGLMPVKAATTVAGRTIPTVVTPAPTPTPASVARITTY
jgi:predicted phage tail protein